MFRLSKSDFHRLLADARVIEADWPYIKVLLFPDGDFLKLFHCRRFFSSARLYPYSRRFCRNARRLQRLQIPTVDIQTLFRIPHLRCTAVRYSPLPGATLREVWKRGEMNRDRAEQYGRFLADLHARGVYFRAVHPGNTVLTPDGRLGLIDMAQMRVFRQPLSQHHRRKNLVHISRSQHDADFLSEFGADILNAYEFAARFRTGLRWGGGVLKLPTAIEASQLQRAA